MHPLLPRVPIAVGTKFSVANTFAWLFLIYNQLLTKYKFSIRASAQPTPATRTDLEQLTSNIKLDFTSMSFFTR